MLDILFKKTIKFEPIDPLADGLGDEIENERCEPEAINFNDDENADIEQFWREVNIDLHSGGNIAFSDE